MAKKVGELIAMDGGKLGEGDAIVMFPNVIVAVDSKPERLPGNGWAFDVQELILGEAGGPAFKKDHITTWKPVIKVARDDDALKAAGFDLPD